MEKIEKNSRINRICFISFISEQLEELKQMKLEHPIKQSILSPIADPKNVRYIKSTHGRYQLYYNGYLFNRNHSTGRGVRTVDLISALISYRLLYSLGSKTYWRCAQNGKLNCSARIVGNEFGLTVTKPIHNHAPFLSLEKTKCHAAKYLQENF